MKERKHAFTPEQVAELNANHYTHKATPNRIVFTLAFKEFLYSKIREGNLSNPNIFRAAGYDPVMLGLSRMDSFRKDVLSEAKSPEGFHAPRGLSYQEEMEEARKQAEHAKNAEVRIQLLENQVAHLEAQIEFLKKTAVIRKKYHRQPEK